jgi:hypothetical protein
MSVGVGGVRTGIQVGQLAGHIWQSELCLVEHWTVFGTAVASRASCSLSASTGPVTAPRQQRAVVGVCHSRPHNTRPL